MITTTLAAFPSPAQGVWHLGPIPIRAYAVCIIIGIVAALLIGDRRWVARGGERGVIYDIALWAVPFGLIGGRLYHVITDWRTYFGPDGAGPVAALRIWDGGLGIWGAVALGGVGAWIGCRRRGIPLPAFGDAIAPGIVLAQAIGRLGNYFNQELYGRATDLPWGLEIFYRQDPSGIVSERSLNGVSTGEIYATVHPTFLYELLWNLLVFVLLLLIDRRWKLGHGRLFATYVALYCVGRFCVELLRDDHATLLAGIRINSYTSVFVFLGAVVYIILATKGREDPSLLRGRDDDDDEDVLAPALAEELVAVAGATGVVAAATVAGAEDSEYDAEADVPADADASEFVEQTVAEAGSEAEADGEEAEAAEDVDAGGPETDVESAAEVEVEEPGESEAKPGDAEPVHPEGADEPDDEAILEAEAAGPGVEVETVAGVEEELIDDDHDPVDDPEFEEFLGDDDSGAPDAAETAPADAEEPGEAPVDVAPEAIDAAIDEAVAIEQVTDTEDSESVDQSVDGADSSVVVDSAESDSSMVIVESDTEEAAPDASMVVITGRDAEEVSSDDETVADDAGDVTPESEDAATDDVAAEDGDMVDDDVVVGVSEPETSAPTPARDGESTGRSRFGALFRRKR